MVILENVRDRIEQHPAPDESWLWCEYCERFFQYKSADTTGLFARDKCPFTGCAGCGLGLNLFMWDDMREPDDPRWPSSVAELEHGMRSPQMAPFYDAQLRARIHALLSAFSCSPELGHALGYERPRYLAAFLQMMSDLCWDLTVRHECEAFDAEMVPELVRDLPVWSETNDIDEAARMTAEIHAFFAFAERTGAVQHARDWRELLTTMDLEALFTLRMHVDRLRPRAPTLRRSSETKHRRAPLIA